MYPNVSRERYRLTISVEGISGYCPVYRVGDQIIVDDFYIVSGKSSEVCLHALSSMTSFLSPLANGVSAIDSGIGKEDSVGYVKCPDPGPPLTNGGTVIFKIMREKIVE